MCTQGLAVSFYVTNKKPLCDGLTAFSKRIIQTRPFDTGMNPLFSVLPGRTRNRRLIGTSRTTAKLFASLEFATRLGRA